MGGFTMIVSQETRPCRQNRHHGKYHRDLTLCCAKDGAPVPTVRDGHVSSPLSPLHPLAQRGCGLLLSIRDHTLLGIRRHVKTSDDQMLSAASRNRAKLKVRVVAVVELAREVLT
jgi:hypothetical protein